MLNAFPSSLNIVDPIMGSVVDNHLDFNAVLVYRNQKCQDGSKPFLDVQNVSINPTKRTENTSRLEINKLTPPKSIFFFILYFLLNGTII